MPGILEDGFSTTYTFAADPTVLMEEKEVQPPGVEGGGEIDVSTMHNTAWRTRAPKQLKTLTEASGTVAYDVGFYPEIIAMININQLITINFPDGSTLVFWGWIDAFTPNALVEGEQPTAEIRIICSNRNDSGVETAPVYDDGVV